MIEKIEIIKVHQETLSNFHIDNFKKLLDSIPEFTSVLLDFENVNYISSGIIGIIIQASQKRKISIYYKSGGLEKIFRIVRLGNVLPLHTIFKNAYEELIQ